jgi:hypothetical protein
VRTIDRRLIAWLCSAPVIGILTVLAHAFSWSDPTRRIVTGVTAAAFVGVSTLFIAVPTASPDGHGRRVSSLPLFVAAVAQRSLATGVAYVAVLIAAYDRLGGVWALVLVMLAFLIPELLIDDFVWPRAPVPSFPAALMARDVTWCAVALGATYLPDAVAAPGLALAATAAGALSVLERRAAVGTFLVSENLRLLAVFDALKEFGRAVGPAVAALLFLLGLSTHAVLVGCAIAFGGTAVLSSVTAPRPQGAELSEQMAGDRRGRRHSALRHAWSRRAIRWVIATAGVTLLFAGMQTVGEFLLTRNEFGAGNEGFAAAVALGGLGFVIGMGMDARYARPPRIRLRYLSALALMGVAMLLLALVPSIALAYPIFVVAGLSNAYLVTEARRLIAQSAEEQEYPVAVWALHLTLAVGLAGSFIAAASIASLFGVRVMFASGAAGIAVLTVAALLTTTASFGPAVRATADSARSPH